MEQLLEKQRRGQAKLRDMADMRAMELQMERPQTMNRNVFEDTIPHSRGGGMAGLQRVIGRGKGKKAKDIDMEELDMEEMEEGGTNGVMKGGAMKMGKELGEQMKRLHGDKFLDEFHRGVMSVAPKYGKGSAISGRPSGLQVDFAPMSKNMGLPGSALGGEDVPPGGLAPMAYGNVPQAPASFMRNTVGAGKCDMGMSKRGAGPVFSRSRVRIAPEPLDDEVLPGQPRNPSLAPLAGDEDFVPRGVFHTPRAIMVQRPRAMVQRPSPAMTDIQRASVDQPKRKPGLYPTNKLSKGRGKRGAGLLGEMGKGTRKVTGGKREKRGMIISQLMRGTGMTLGQASKHLKENPELMD